MGNRYNWASHRKLAQSPGGPVPVLLFFVLFYICFFSPVLFSGRVLAPGDGSFFYYPHYNSPFRSWTPLLMTGYPELADPQLMRWYPLSLLLHIFPGSWNAFMVLAYVLASWFMYLFVRQLTHTDFAGLVSGLIFGLCGFMSAHLGHTTMIQSAVWIPAILLCVEHAAGGIQWRWVALGGLATGACILAGHPQIALYGMTLVLGYVIVRGFSAAPVKLHYYAATALMIAMGLALSAVQTIPTAEMAGFSTRASLTFAEFSTYALPPRQVPLLLFPFLLGGASTIPYFGAGNITEIAGYVGLSGLVLAAIAVVSRRTVSVLFWFVSMVVSVIASMGPATPLGRILYALPAFGQFRVPGRFLVLFGISAAVLAGYGMASILERRQPLGNRLLTIAAGLGLILSAAWIAVFFGASLHKAAAASGAPQYSASAFANWWIGAPLLISCTMCAVLVLLIRKPESLPLRGLFALTVIVELSAFSWYGEWRFASPGAQALQPPDLIRRNAPAVRRMDARWVPVRGYRATPLEAPADLSLLWQLPSLSKYGPLLPARYQELLNMETNGQFIGRWWEPQNRAIDISAGRFIAVPENQAGAGQVFRGVQFSSQDLSVSVGNGCGADSQSVSVPVGKPKEIRGLALVTLTGCSAGFEQGMSLAELRLQEPGGASIPLSIRASVDTAEWAAACADVALLMKHPAAEVYSRSAVPRNGGICQAQTYVDIIELPKPVMVSRLDFRWLPAGVGILKIDKISLLDAKAGISLPLSEQDVRLGDPTRWKRIDQAGGVEIYENLRAQPRAWLTSETLSAPPEEIQRAIQTSRLPDGRPYQPAAVALVEEPLGFRVAAPDPDARATLLEDTGSSLAIQTFSKQPAFLVLADFYYPGWEATVNGRPTHIFRTNYIQRGIRIPPGNSSVRFEFHPVRVYAGGAISLATLAGMIGTAFFRRRHGRS